MPRSVEEVDDQADHHPDDSDRTGGRMGGDQVTVKNLRVAKIDAENNLIYIRGAVPGGRNGLVIVRLAKSGKRGE